MIIKKHGAKEIKKWLKRYIFLKKYEKAKCIYGNAGITNKNEKETAREKRTKKVLTSEKGSDIIAELA